MTAPQIVSSSYRTDPWFWTCASAAACNTEFISQWARLRGLPPPPRSAIEAMVDQATGAIESQCELFLRGVLDLIYLRLPRPHARAG